MSNFVLAGMTERAVQGPKGWSTKFGTLYACKCRVLYSHPGGVMGAAGRGQKGSTKFGPSPGLQVPPLPPAPPNAVTAPALAPLPRTLHGTGTLMV